MCSVGCLAVEYPQSSVPMVWGYKGPRYAAQTVEAVEFMHGKGLVHGDVKPDNVILVKKSETLTVAKLADLGLSREVGTTKYKGFGTLGTSITPNNYFDEVPADKADDVWALGVLLLSLLLPRGLFSSNYLTSRVLQTAAEKEALARCRTSKQRLKIKYRMSSRTAKDTSDNGFQKRMVRSMLFVTLEQPIRDTARDFLRRMVDPDASKRPDICEVRAWLPSIVRSAERQTAVMAAAALVPTTPSPPPPRSPLMARSRGSSVSTISFSSSGGSSESSSSSSSSAARTSDSASSPSAGSAPSAGGSVEPFSSSVSCGRSGNYSAVVVPAVVPLTSGGSVLSARSPVESGSSVSSSSDGRSWRLAVLLEDEDGMEESGEREYVFPSPSAAAAITPSMAASSGAQREGVDNSAPDSWVPSHDVSSLALSVGAAASAQDDVARHSGPEDAWSTGISGVVSGIDAAVGINSSADISQQQGELSSSAGSVRFSTGAEAAAGESDGLLLLPLLSGGECSTGWSRQSRRGGEGEATVDAGAGSDARDGVGRGIDR
ncbi:protein kinase [Ectocarpus siliculosus]|uniref:non-specific serine/threonine protein kinase n=1 Tax=Ectocarpus siliculosus TaxID=2880 RepID=D7FI65_ECTSI|nr:protein kinase [Ectocarpus siliculosus]|eukprot:CBJ34166.1 protein kinase [Ectocarpus siliculosus]